MGKHECLDDPREGENDIRKVRCVISIFGRHLYERLAIYQVEKVASQGGGATFSLARGSGPGTIAT